MLKQDFESRTKHVLTRKRLLSVIFQYAIQS